jgi:hypothetical protein
LLFVLQGDNAILEAKAAAAYTDIQKMQRTMKKVFVHPSLALLLNSYSFFLTFFQIPIRVSQANRQLDIDKVEIALQSARMESRVKLHAWKVGIKKRLLERQLQHEQVFFYIKLIYISNSI